MKGLDIPQLKGHDRAGSVADERQRATDILIGGIRCKQELEPAGERRRRRRVRREAGRRRRSFHPDRSRHRLVWFGCLPYQMRCSADELAIWRPWEAQSCQSDAVPTSAPDEAALVTPGLARVASCWSIVSRT